MPGRKRIKMAHGYHKELKFVDKALSKTLNGTGVTTTLEGTEGLQDTSIVEIAQGDGQSQRDGRKVEIRSIVMKGLIRADELPSTATWGDIQGQNLVRVDLMLDRMCNNVDPDFSDIFRPASGTPLQVVAAMDLAHTRRYVSLDHAVISVDVSPAIWDGDTTTPAYKQGAHYVPFELKWNGSVVATYSATSGQVDSITDNNFFACARWISNSALTETQPTTMLLEGYVRARYYDL